MSGHYLHYIHPDNIDQYWFLVEHKLGKAIKYADDKYTAESVFRMLKAREMQLWIVKKDYDFSEVAVTQVVKYPNKKVLVMMFVGGENVDAYKHLIDEIKRFARFNGCESIEFYGRHGWIKKVHELGFEHIHSVFRMKLEKGKSHERTGLL